MDDRNHFFQRLCHEAVLACGSDVGAIERYVMDRIDALESPEYDHIKRDIERVLAFRAPTRPARPH